MNIYVYTYTYIVKGAFYSDWTKIQFKQLS